MRELTAKNGLAAAHRPARFDHTAVGALLARLASADRCKAFACLTATLLLGLVMEIGSAQAATATDAVIKVPAASPASDWLKHYLSLAAKAPASCPPVTMPRLDHRVPARVFILQPDALQNATGPLVATMRDSIVEQFIVLAEDANGCIHAGESGRAVPFDWRSVSSPFPNTRLPDQFGATPPIAIAADPRVIRPWIDVEPLHQFKQEGQRDWVLMGVFTGMLASFLVAALVIAHSQGGPLIWAYLGYLICLQFFQLQQLGLGPAWLPFWPPASANGLLQAVVTGTTLLSMVVVVVIFLRPKGWLRIAIFSSGGLSIAAFYFSALDPSTYRFAAAALLAVAILVVWLLMRRLRSGNASVRWFALGIAAAILGAGTQALAVVTEGAWLPPQAGYASPFGNVVEALCWLLAIVNQMKAQQLSLQEQQLSEFRYDSLTDGYNRRYLRTRISLALAEAKRTGSASSGLLYIELCGFRDIKDRFGQAVGDDALRRFSTILQEMHFNADAIGRYGGHEFVVLMRHDAHWSQAEGAATTILSRFQEALVVGDHSILVRPDIGIVRIGAQYSDVDEIMEDASRALRVSSQLGGRRATLFEPRMRDRAKVEQTALNALEDAIRNHQVDLAYQPMVAFDTMLPVGLEALLRCPHLSEKGITVEQILTVAEAAGMLNKIGEHVIELALGQIIAWQRKGLWSTGLFLSINVREQQLIDGRLLEHLHRATQAYGVDASTIRLELAENSLGANLDWSRQVLPRLLNQHILFGIDHFGAGVASLTMLTDLQPDYIKLDQRLVGTLPTSTRAQNLARAAQLFAAETGCLAIADGIETNSHLESLRELGFEHGQGSLIAAPMSSDDTTSWLQLAARAHDKPQTDRAQQWQLH